MATLLAHPAFDSVADSVRLHNMQEDFVSGGTATVTIGQYDWTLTQSNGSVAYSTAAGHPGILTLAAATSGFACAISLTQLAYRIDNPNGLYFGALFRIPSALTNREVRLGFSNAVAVDSDARPAKGVWIEYEQGEAPATLFQGVVRDTGVTAINGPAAIADNWFLGEIAATKNGVYFYINGEPFAANPIAVAANIPDDVPLTPFVSVGDGGNAQTLGVDFIQVRAPILNRVGTGALNVEGGFVSGVPSGS